MAQWMQLQQWILRLRFFPENLKLGEGGEEGRANDIARETFERTGASVMGKRMFDLGEQAWPEDAPFHTPVFVRDAHHACPWQRPGGPLLFVNDSIETPLDQALEAAGVRDVRAAGGGATILLYLNTGLIDEFSIALSPVLFGSPPVPVTPSSKNLCGQPIEKGCSNREAHLGVATATRRPVAFVRFACIDLFG